MMSVHTVGTIDQEACGKLKEMTQQRANKSNVHCEYRLDF